ncbi:MAG: putative ABC transporter ATP-binding protein YknY [Thermoanaerobaculia bacterium]|nr:putative ABC transporter ATP-binding protein YknY [Thermoanaerobaculia bacterium]
MKGQPLQAPSFSLELRNVSRSLPSGRAQLSILSDISLGIRSGQFAAILGPSGSGKSTLLGLMAGLDRPSSGQILIDGEPIEALEEDALALLRRKKIGFVFQSFQLLPNLTAKENVLFPLELLGLEGAEDRADGLLAAVGLGQRGHHYPVQLSGGEQQRVALARAFAPEPSILLADEPTGNLDSATGEAVLNLLTRLWKESRATLVLVTHDQELAVRAERRIHLRDGRIHLDEGNA